MAERVRFVAWLPLVLLALFPIVAATADLVSNAAHRDRLRRRGMTSSAGFGP